MNYLIDIHTHTLASGHAYNTMDEMITAAKEKGLSYYGITEHAPTMPGTCHLFYFQNLRIIPREYKGMRLLLGTEANIIDYDGNVDFPQPLLEELDIVIASLHNPCYDVGNATQNTAAYIHAMQNPAIKVIGHPDDGRIPVDYETLVKSAKKYHTALEVNNSSLSPYSFRPNAKENIIHYLTICKEEKVPIILGSDAHIKNAIGNFSFAEEIIKEISFPEDLIINLHQHLIKEYLLS